MISNYVIENKIKRIKDEISGLAKEKFDLAEAIKALCISKQAAWKHKQGLIKNPVNDNLFAIREKYAARITEIEGVISSLHDESRELHRLKESDKNGKLLEIFGEIFTPEQMLEMKKEAERRMAGEHPFRLSFNIQEAVQIKEQLLRSRKVAKEQLEKMIEFRLLLTRIIEDGCQKFGDKEFLTVISPLNRLIIPIAELEKLKRSLFL
jgi:hypothetical protein